jgi:hypothetical protein
MPLLALTAALRFTRSVQEVALPHSESAGGAIAAGDLFSEFRLQPLRPRLGCVSREPPPARHVTRPLAPPKGNVHVQRPRACGFGIRQRAQGRQRRCDTGAAALGPDNASHTSSPPWHRSPHSVSRATAGLAPTATRRPFSHARPGRLYPSNTAGPPPLPVGWLGARRVPPNLLSGRRTEPPTVSAIATH